LIHQAAETNFKLSHFHSLQNDLCKSFIFDTMKASEINVYNKVCKWLSLFVVLAVIYYWLMTIGMVFFGNKISLIAPRQAFLYRTFCRQNWGLFARTKVYNRQMNFIIREKEHPSVTDTIDLERYLIAEKRKYAPFNNYQETMEKILHATMNALEIQVDEEITKIKKRYPGKSPDFYIQQASITIQADSLIHQHIDNIISFGKDVMKIKKIDFAGKEYQLCIIHKFIPPVNSKELPATESNKQIIFISAYKPF
jgi:hypothetical protein